ncbi:MAG: twin-arginine translocation signal domain-containing protein, partial [Candidatus Rokubacteria bacterium]|nr:twin-arginine translocation signal domain-containing protein [Candidatus Rokubacteria bacterium]
MPGSIDRRTFLKRTGTAAVAVLAAPLVIPSR